MTFITEKYLQREHFLAKEHSLFEDLSIHFELLLEWKFVYVCHDLKNEEYGIDDKWPKYRISIWNTNDLHHGNKASKGTFFSKIGLFFGDLYIHFEHLLWWGCA